MPRRALLAVLLTLGMLVPVRMTAAPADFTVPYDYFTLPNGLKVVVSPDKSAPIVLVEVMYNIGFRVVCTVAMVIILMGAHLHAVLVLAIGVFLVGSGIGGQIPIQETIWATYFGRRYLGEVRSVALPFSLFLSAGGPLAVAYYFDRVGNYDGAFIGLGTMWALAAVLVLLVRRPAVGGQRPDARVAPVPMTAQAGAPRPMPTSSLASAPHANSFQPVAAGSSAQTPFRGRGASGLASRAGRPREAFAPDYGLGTYAAPGDPRRPDYMSTGEGSAAGPAPLPTAADLG